MARGGYFPLLTCRSCSVCPVIIYFLSVTEIQIEWEISGSHLNFQPRVWPGHAAGKWMFEGINSLKAAYVSLAVERVLLGFISYVLIFLSS